MPGQRLCRVLNVWSGLNAAELGDPSIALLLRSGLSHLDAEGLATGTHRGLAHAKENQTHLLRQKAVQGGRRLARRGADVLSIDVQRDRQQQALPLPKSRQCFVVRELRRQSLNADPIQLATQRRAHLLNHRHLAPKVVAQELHYRQE